MLTKNLGIGLGLATLIAGLSASTPQCAAQTNKSSTTLTSTGTQGNYVFTSTVIGSGAPNPTGSVVFTDSTTGTTLGTVALGTANTTGGFNSPASLSSQYNPDGATVADVNGDGIPDLIIALSNPYASANAGAAPNNNPGCGFCPGPQNIQVYLGKGDGTFQSPAYYQAGFNPDHITVADLNGDGYPDLIVTNNFPVFGGTQTSGGAYPTAENFYDIGVYINKGASAPGTYNQPVYYRVGSNPISVVAGNFTGRGFVDLIVANAGDNTLQLFPGNGTGTFANPISGPYSAPVQGTNSDPASTIVATNIAIENNHGFAAADVNGDGILDLIGVNYNTGQVEVLLGNGAAGKGNGTFAAAVNYPAATGTATSTNPVGVALGDVNGDGILDIVTSNRGSGNVGVLIGNGDGTFKPVVTYPIGDSNASFANGVTLADMNADGKLDIVVADNGTTYDLGVLYGKGDGTFGARAGVSAGPGSGTPLVADFNKDGRLDIGTENFGPNSTSLLLGYTTESAQLTGINLPGATTDTVVAKYNGDAKYLPSTSNTLSLAAGGLANPAVASPSAVTAGTPFTLTVTETNRNGSAANYTGTLTFTSSDPLAVLPPPSTLTNGTGTFTARLSDDGTQTITIADAANNISTTTPFSVSGGVLVVSGYPSPDANGTPHNVTVTVKDNANNVMTGFLGTVTLTSTDPSATFSPASYTFQASDAGVKNFSVTLATGGTQTISASSPTLTSGSQTAIAVSDFVWVVNANGSLTKLTGAGTVAATSAGGASVSTAGGVAFDNTGNAWSVSTGANSLLSTTRANGALTTYTGGGLSTPDAIAIDGSGRIWVANSGNSTISLFSNGTPQSGATGYGTSDGLQAPSSIALDATGGVWVTNKTGNSLTHIFGAATPVTTPLSTATGTATLGVQP
jgi:hypothetical protein